MSGRVEEGVASQQDTSEREVKKCRRKEGGSEERGIPRSKEEEKST